ncbi:chromosome segregation ATPase [Burkholderia sola]|nr:chromosome segregation ATPase [Burkholderia cenocepacia]
MLIPVEADVDSEVTVLFVVLRPVDNEVTPLCAVLIPVDADVDSEVTVLFVVLRPVDNEVTPL